MAQCTPKSFDLTGKVALITGASYGIGMAIVVDAADAERTKALFEAEGETVYTIGEIRELPAGEAPCVVL